LLDVPRFGTYFQVMSGFQRAREALGARLREIRRSAHLTGRQLAESQGWHPSKVSKIESGRQTASSADVTAWAAACGFADQTGELLATLQVMDDQYLEFRRMFRSGQRGKQVELSRLESETEVVRNFESVFVPGLLQTPGYARSRLAEGLEAMGAPDDVDEAVAARMARQQVLYRATSSRRRHHFVITEAVLRYRLCATDALAEQLDRLVAATALTTIRFGVIPFSQPLPVAPVHGFHLYDDHVVYVEHLTGELKLTEPAEVRTYLAAFGQLAGIAVYGAQARGLIVRALGDLAELSEPGEHREAEG
jgi:transcriptional regulator with XRE-family HTH domain